MYQILSESTKFSKRYYKNILAYFLWDMVYNKTYLLK